MSEQVHQMFSQIAPRYDATNDVLSMGVHRLWRRVAVRRAAVQAGDSVLDCATGTGDLALAFKRAVGPTGEVIGTDFNAEMLSFAPKKAAQAGLAVKFEVADAMKLPYESSRFTVASISFGIRNVDDPKACVAELARVVQPGGRVVVLEFGQPKGLFGACFRFYAKHVMPLLVDFTRQKHRTRVVSREYGKSSQQNLGERRVILDNLTIERSAKR